MEPGMIIFEFASSEQEFIHGGANSGYTMVYQKVNRCFLLSSEARQLYTNISSYAYAGKRDCFPGQDTLRAELGWQRDRFSKYLNELKDYGLITTKKRYSNTMVYRIEELHRIPILAHADMVRGLESEVDSETFFEDIIRYRKSELCESILKEPNPYEYRDKVLNWFLSCNREEMEVSEPEEIKEPVKEPVKSNLPKIVRVGDIQKTSDPLGEGKKKQKKEVDPYKVEVADWNKNHFYSYFKEEYQRIVGKPYVDSVIDKRNLSLVIDKRNDKELVKKLIDTFLSLDFFNIKTAKAFSSTGIQAILDNYLNSGKLPSYKVPEESLVDDDYADDFKNFFGE